MAAATSAALGFLPALGLRTPTRSAVLLTLGCVVLLSPLLIPSDAPIVRLLVAIFGATLLMKMWDLHLGALRGDRPGFNDFLAFMTNPFLLVYRKRGLEPQPSKTRSVADLVLGLLGGLAACAALLLTTWVDWSKWPFLVEHALKATAFFLLGLAYFQIGAAAIRFLGGYVVRTGDRPRSALTPAAAALTLRLRPHGGSAVVWQLGTLAFNATTSVLFFASCNGVLQIYQGALPRFLACF